MRGSREKVTADANATAALLLLLLLQSRRIHNGNAAPLSCIL